MDSVPFPHHVEKFIEALKRFLVPFGYELHENSSEGAIQSRFFELIKLEGHEKRPGRTKLIIHRTSRSFDKAVGEYRARACTQLPEENVRGFVGIEDLVNQFATLGALITDRSGGEVACQSLIQENTFETTAGIMATTMIFAAASMVLSITKQFQSEPPNAVHALSAWTDLDFEQLHYDYAHLGVGSISRREWSQSRPFGLVRLSAVDNNPFWGGGLLTLLRPNQDYFRVDGHEPSINELNRAAFLFDDAPTFGAWCKRDGAFWFASFAPNFLKQLPGFTDFIVDTAKIRMATTRSLVKLTLELRPEAGR
jgi:hypothetical protein